jgi:L-fuculose-phosphate aldolase
MMPYGAARAQVLAAAQAMLTLGLTVGSSGNVSARVCDEGAGPQEVRPHQGRSPRLLLLAITPHSRGYERMTPEDILVVDEEGEPVAGDGIPSLELGLHAAIYRSRPDAGGVIHAHSPMASAAAVVRRPIPPILEDQVIYLGGQIEVAPPASTGSSELAANALRALGERNACLLANHGALAVGIDPGEALHNLQYLEKLAQVFLFALSTGKVNSLPAEMVQTASAFFRMR